MIFSEMIFLSSRCSFSMEQSKKNLKATEPIFLKKQLKLPNTGGLKGTAFKLFSISKAIIMS